MTREEIIHFANCLKNNYTIDFNNMEEFCNEVIKSQNKLRRIEYIVHNSKWGLGETYRRIAEVLENE